MIEQVERYPTMRDRAIFIGRPEDIVEGRFGPGLPKIREWTEEHYRFSGGYVLELEPGTVDRDQLRRDLGYRPDEVVAVATVGGSGWEARCSGKFWNLMRRPGCVFATCV